MRDMAKPQYERMFSDLRARSGLSIAELAHGMGYKNASSIQRYFSDPMPAGIPPRIVNKASAVLVGRGNPPITEAEVAALAGEMLIVAPNDGENQGMPVDGRVAAGTWQERDMLDEPLGHIPIAYDKRHPRRQYALKVDGESMNKYVPSGAWVVVAESFGYQPRDGDVIVVRRTQGSLVERTLKRARMVAGRVELHPESTDPRFLPIIANGDDSIEIEVEGYVIGRYLPP